MFKKKNARAWIAGGLAVLLIVIGTLLTRDRGVPAQTETLPGDETTLLQAPKSDSLIAATQYELTETEAATGSGTFAVGGMPPAQAGTLKIIRTANLTIDTLQYDADEQALLSLIERFGGWIEQQRLFGQPFAQSGSGRSLSLTLRIPSEGMNSFVDEACKIGTLQSRESNAQDISGMYYDTDGRLKSAQTQLTTLQSLLAHAESMEDLITIVQSIDEVQLTIDQLSGTLRSWDSSVDYAQVWIHLTERQPRDQLLPQPRTLGQRTSEGFFGALNGIVAFFGDAAVFAVSMLPWLAILCPAVLLIWFVVRKNAKRRARKIEPSQPE